MTVIEKAKITLDGNPIPNSMTSTGASASFGRAFKTIRYGSLIPAYVFDHQKVSPSAEPITVPSTKPKIVEPDV